MALNISYVNNKEYAPEMDVNLNKTIMGEKTIIGTNSLKVSANTTANMGVKVAIGSCWINGYFINNTASYPLTITGNTSGYSRIDAIVIEGSATGAFIKVVQGTASNTPTCPSIANNQIKLAEVTVINNATAIQTSNIKDTRSNIINSLDASLHAVEDRVKDLESGKLRILENYTQTNDYILHTKLAEFQDTGYKISSMYFYLNANYIKSTKVSGKNYSVITLPYYFGIGTTYSVNITLSTSQGAALSGKFGSVSHSTPTSNGFTIFLENKNNEMHDCTLYVTVYGK